MSFSILALDQIINHAAKIHYMTGGQATVPMVVRGPGGAAKQLSAQHSHSMEGWYAHVPGLKVVAPATAVDAYGMFKTAVRDNNPVIFTENPVLYGVKGDVPVGTDFAVEFGKAQVLREGTDVSLVAYSRMKLYDISQLPVMDQDQIIGIVDESDLLLALHADSDAFQRQVKTIMSQKLTTVDVKASVESLLPIFERGLVAIVMDGKRFLGLITRIDVLNYLRRKTS